MKMKNLIKLYKMFYRLLRLKAWQRREIEQIAISQYNRTLKQIYEEFFIVKTELNDYKSVMIQHCINDPVELFNALAESPIKDDVTLTELVFLKDRLKAQYNHHTNQRGFNNVLFRININEDNGTNNILFPLTKVCYINYHNDQLSISFDNKQCITISGKDAEEVFIALAKAMEK